jgi:hypothetical protein
VRKFTAIQDAVHSPPTSATLKRDALVFDQMYLIKLPAIIESLRNYKPGDYFTIDFDTLTTQRVEKDPDELRAFASELDWLISKEIIADASTIVVDDEYHRMIELQDRAELSSLMRADGLIGIEEVAKLGQHAARSWLRKAWAMYKSCYKRGEDVTCFLPLSGLTEDLDHGVCDIAHIVVHSLPIPKDDTPWEQIFEFREDEQSRDRLTELRHWMRKMTTKDVTQRELEDEIETLLHSYHRHMQVHKMKTDPGVLETIVTIGPAFLGNVMKLNFGEAAQALFTAKHRKIALLEAELTAPGKELAYISQVEKHFV